MKSERQNKHVEVTGKQVWDSRMVVRDVKLCSFGNDQAAARMWMIPREWHEFHESQRLTHQYILMKIKLFVTYESFEDGIKLTFEEFMKLPQRKSDKEFLNFFPMFRFKILLMNLTYDQKKDYVERHITCCREKSQLKIMRAELE
jgi:hypothetical protein